MSKSRPIIPGETIPLEVFSEQIKRHAQSVGDTALKAGGVMPPQMQELLDADEDELRTLQINKKMSYADLERIFQYKNISKL